jgi:hypothetical protein
MLESRLATLESTVHYHRRVRHAKRSIVARSAASAGAVPNAAKEG